MLWYIVVILLVLWLVGFLGLHILGAAIHVLLILAVIFFVVAL
ncbi:MAG: lmo0937 family membrane protein, partial [Chthoniobacterales bacterium]